jgi:hypothetical protein
MTHGLRPLLAGCLVLAWLVALSTAGCTAVQSKVREVLGYGPAPDPTIALKGAETRWLLVKNPRFGDVPSEPEYVWVEEDKVPVTVKTLVMGKGSIIAPPEIVAKYGSPPGGGKISPRQGGPYTVDPGGPPGKSAPSAPGPAKQPPAAPPPGAAAEAPVAEEPPPERGYVVYVDTKRVVIDLTGRDGLQRGALVSVRRDKLPIVHPVTGELLGEIDDEVATARVTEIREKFSIAEIQTLSNGTRIQVKDRVVLK